MLASVLFTPKLQWSLERIPTPVHCRSQATTIAKRKNNKKPSLKRQKNERITSTQQPENSQYTLIIKAYCSPIQMITNYIWVRRTARQVMQWHTQLSMGGTNGAASDCVEAVVTAYTIFQPQRLQPLTIRSFTSTTTQQQYSYTFYQQLKEIIKVILVIKL